MASIWRSSRVACPEDPVKSYIPDNDAVDVEILSENALCLKVKLTPEIEKSIIMRVATEGQGFELVNQIRNLSDKPIRTASWGITTFAPGGVGYLPIPKAPSATDALCASFQINLWDYTSFPTHLLFGVQIGSNSTRIGLFKTESWANQ
jgi:hypothetical protein